MGYAISLSMSEQLINITDVACHKQCMTSHERAESDANYRFRNCHAIFANLLA